MELRSDSGQIPKPSKRPVAPLREPVETVKAKPPQCRNERIRNDLQLRWLLQALRERLRQ
jgi:hypothetical protein